MNDKTKMIGRIPVCNNMNSPEDIKARQDDVLKEVKTIDMTPSWGTAITIYFQAIRHHIRSSGVNNVVTARKEMMRLANGFDQANERTEHLEDKLKEARDGYGSIMQELTDLSVFETSQGTEVVESNDITYTCSRIADQIIAWTNEE
jgi:hypothetical protein